MAFLSWNAYVFFMLLCMSYINTSKSSYGLVTINNYLFLEFDYLRQFSDQRIQTLCFLPYLFD
jgi:hypothetical protein